MSDFDRHAIEISGHQLSSLRVPCGFCSLPVTIGVTDAVCPWGRCHFRAPGDVSDPLWWPCWPPSPWGPVRSRPSLLPSRPAPLSRYGARTSRRRRSRRSGWAPPGRRSQLRKRTCRPSAAPGGPRRRSAPPSRPQRPPRRKQRRPRQRTTCPRAREMCPGTRSPTFASPTHWWPGSTTPPGT